MRLTSSRNLPQRRQIVRITSPIIILHYSMLTEPARFQIATAVFLGSHKGLRMNFDDEFSLNFALAI